MHGILNNSHAGVERGLAEILSASLLEPPQPNPERTVPLVEQGTDRKWYAVEQDGDGWNGPFEGEAIRHALGTADARPEEEELEGIQPSNHLPGGNPCTVNGDAYRNVGVHAVSGSPNDR